MPEPRRLADWLPVVWPFALAAALGIFLRVHSFENLRGEGFDEKLYATYVGDLASTGLTHYPELVRVYLKGQSAYPIALLPPTRVTFIVTSTAWKCVFGASAIESVRAVSCLASILTLAGATALAWRMRGRTFALAVLLLMAVAPSQIYMAHRALIDGFFGLIALATLTALWEALQAPPSHRIWPVLFGFGLIMLVATKENALFVFIAVVGLLVANRWFRFGRVSRELIIATVLAPLLGAAVLAWCAGGFDPLIEVFTLNLAKTLQTPYATATGDGPWFRYLSDLLLVSPAVTLFAVGGAFRLVRQDTAGWFLFGFLVLTYVPMCNVTYGMNLRYGNMWDFPLRYLALVPICGVGSPAVIGRRPWGVPGVVLLLALFELANYLRVFVASDVYDPTPSALMKALDMIKPLPGE